MRSRLPFLTLTLLLLAVIPAVAQRQMDRLGRGLVVLRSSTSQAYVGWRLLTGDPDGVSFNVYRVSNGGSAIKLNSAPLTNSTDFVDAGASLAVTNYWYVKPVVNGIEGPASVAVGLPANAPVRQYIPLPLKPVLGGPNPPYSALHCWPGDLDGDGEFDYVVVREAAGTNNLPPYQFAQAYRRDGTLLWQLNAGHNSTNQYSYGPGSTILVSGASQHMVVYDLDGDGRAEVIAKTGNGVVTLSPQSNVVSTIVAPESAEFLSVFDGLTGLEKARCVVTNPWPADGFLYGRLVVAYADGVRPSVLFPCENRVDSTGAFQECGFAFDYQQGVLKQRWFALNSVSRGHQNRVADVDHDGTDDLVEIGGVYRGQNGSLLFDTPLTHGDRFHTTDMDPDRRGLETFAIQQNNPSLLATSLYEAGTGTPIRNLYTGSVADVGRGDSGDFDPRYPGVESFSTIGGLYDAKGNLIPNASVPFPTLGIWWDADLRREFMSGAGSTLMSPTIDKWVVNTTYPNGANTRLYSIYNEGVYQGYGGRPPFLGDILGDWREEVMLLASDNSELRIYCTKIAATNRLYCLMQNAAYRLQSLCRGYTQSPFTDYYLGETMQPPVPSPAVDSRLVWRGSAANAWDLASMNWRSNWTRAGLSTTNPVAFTTGDSVLFDLTGSNHAAVTLSSDLAPGSVTVFSPKSFVFSGPGALTGPMKLTKAGGGSLTLSGTNTFSGATTVWEGDLVVYGNLTGSPVTVRGGTWLDGALSGSGLVAQPVLLHRGASLSPGPGTNAPGTLALGSGLTVSNGAFLRFDLSDDPSGVARTNDLLKISGNLTLLGTNYVSIQLLNGSLPQGAVYPLMQYSGVLSGSLSNLVIIGLPGIPTALTNPPGQIALVVKAYPAPTTITWSGGASANAWDLLTTSNWLAAAALRSFAPQDSVRFDDSGSSNPIVNLVGDLTPSSVTVDATAGYSLAGPGRLIGSTGLTKTNSGTLTMNAANNTFTGPTRVSGGILAVSRLEAVGFPSPLGNPGASPTNVVLSGNATLRVMSESYTDRGLTLSTGTNSLDIFNAADQLTMAGNLVGSGALQKIGAGSLALTRSNRYSGGTIIKAGTVSLGGGNANQYALGTGTVILDGGVLTMFDDTGSYDACYWNLVVPTGSSGMLNADSRCYLYGSLTGGGTLTVRSPYVRTEFAGNWSAFTGQLNITTDADGGDFRINNSSGYPNALVELAPQVNAYHLSGSSVRFGALSGVAGSKLNGSTWIVGSRNTDATFAGNISGNSIVKVGTGTWTLSGTNTYTGSTSVSNGVLRLLSPSGSATGSGLVTVAAGGTLSGHSRVDGPTLVLGSIAPGSGSNTLTFNGGLTLESSALTTLQLGRVTGVNDSITVAGPLTFRGRLVVTNPAPLAMAAGDKYKLFTATALAGSFTAMTLPPLANGLAWNTSKLTSSGTIVVVSTTPPTLAPPQISGPMLSLSVSGGTPGWDYYVLTTTNLSLPKANWSRIATNQFDALGNGTFSAPLNTIEPGRFYQIQVP